MFFIGIFGVQDKSKSIETKQNVICPLCGAYGRYEVMKIYRYFHIFFIPVWKWNVRYVIKTRCCGNVYEIDKEMGQRIEKGESVDIERIHIHHGEKDIIDLCPNCSAQLDPAYSYCPHCGTRIQ